MMQFIKDVRGLKSAVNLVFQNQVEMDTRFTQLADKVAGLEIQVHRLYQLADMDRLDVAIQERTCHHAE